MSPSPAPEPIQSSPRSVAIIGGCGHVGLPLGLSFAKAGLRVTLFDIDKAAIAKLREGVFPFIESGGEELLRSVLGKNLDVSSDPACLSAVDAVVCVVGTPIDEHLNAKVDTLIGAITALEPYLRASQLFVLRSTVFPGVTDKVHAHLQASVPGIDVAFCPERVVQGFAIREIGSMPQIISGVTERALVRARALFNTICPSLVELEPMEAELSKLFCNAWRYISFAVANQFYTLCAENQIDYYAVWEAVTRDYPRMQALPKAGFAAGPCLFKDTMQLAAFSPNDFPLGHAAMLVNENLPRTLVRQLSAATNLKDKTVGILGMAFKADNDDIRESLAFKLRKLLLLECKSVLCTDDHVDLPWLLPLDKVLKESDIVVIGAPHSMYKNLAISQPVIDVWNILGRGGLMTGPELR